jgi:hypothetical protein
MRPGMSIRTPGKRSSRDESRRVTSEAIGATRPLVRLRGRRLQAFSPQAVVGPVDLDIFAGGWEPGTRWILEG